MDRRELNNAAWINRRRGPDTAEDRRRMREEKKLAIDDRVSWKKFDTLGDYEDGTLMAGQYEVTNCKIIGFTPQHFVQIEVPFGVLYDKKTKTRVSPRYLTKKIAG